MGWLFQAIAIAVATILQCVRSATAQEWPGRPVTMVVAFPASGSDDILGRIVASRLSELLGQPVLVENIGGAGGTTGTARVASTAPDGYQVALSTSATHALRQVLCKNLLYKLASTLESSETQISPADCGDCPTTAARIHRFLRTTARHPGTLRELLQRWAICTSPASLRWHEHCRCKAAQAA